MGIKGNLKIMIMLLPIGVGFVSNAQQASVSLPQKYSLSESLNNLPAEQKFPCTTAFSYVNANPVTVTAPTGINYSFLNRQSKTDYFFSRQVFQPLKPDYFTCNQGFFCDQELIFEKKTGLPLRFRLGSLQYVDALEGKK
jgi:hypothetical protein